MKIILIICALLLTGCATTRSLGKIKSQESAYQSFCQDVKCPSRLVIYEHGHVLYRIDGTKAVHYDSCENDNL